MITADSVIQDLESFLYKELIQDNDEKIVLACVSALFKCLHLNFRSSLMYVPTSNNDHSALHESIYFDFNGNNHMELAVKYNRSLQNIYAIVKAQKLIETNMRQSNIFPLPNAKKQKPLTKVVIEDYLPIDLVNAGLSADLASSIALKVSNFLCLKYPGISICISDKMQKKRAHKAQESLF